MKNYTKDFIKLEKDLKELSSLMTRCKNPFFAKDLYQDELEIFLYLAEFGPKTMKNLAEYISVKPNVMSSIAASLEKKGMVSRFGGLKDRRQVWMEIEPKWKQVYQMYIKEQEKISQIIIETIGEKNVSTLLEMLSKSIDKINKMPLVKRSV